MGVDPGLIGPATLSVTQGFTSFNTFLPKLSDVRKASVSSDPDLVGDVRMGEIAAVVTTVGIGVISSSLTGSPVPAYTAVIMCLALVLLYESVLRADRPGDPTLPPVLREDLN